MADPQKWRDKYFHLKAKYKTCKQELAASRKSLEASEAQRIKLATELQRLRPLSLRKQVAQRYEIPMSILRGDSLKELEEHAQLLKELGYSL